MKRLQKRCRLDEHFVGGPKILLKKLAPTCKSLYYLQSHPFLSLPKTSLYVCYSLHDSTLSVFSPRFPTFNNFQSVCTHHRNPHSTVSLLFWLHVFRVTFLLWDQHLQWHLYKMGPMLIMNAHALISLCNLLPFRMKFLTAFFWELLDMP